MRCIKSLTCRIAMGRNIAYVSVNILYQALIIPPFTYKARKNIMAWRIRISCGVSGYEPRFMWYSGRALRHTHTFYEGVSLLYNLLLVCIRTLRIISQNSCVTYQGNTYCLQPMYRICMKKRHDCSMAIYRSVRGMHFLQAGVQWIAVGQCNIVWH